MRPVLVILTILAANAVAEDEHDYQRPMLSEADAGTTLLLQTVVPTPGRRLEVRVLVHGKFEWFLESKGTLDIPQKDPQPYDHGGTIAIRIKSREEILKTQGVFDMHQDRGISLQELDNNWFLGAHIVVSVKEFEGHPEKLVYLRVINHHVFRFISALAQEEIAEVGRQVLAPVGGGADDAAHAGWEVIPYEPTALGRGNTKLIKENWGFLDGGVNYRVDTPGSSFSGGLLSCPGGRCLRYTPTTSPREVAEVGVYRLDAGVEHRIAGIHVTGTGVAPRTWWIDRTGLTDLLARVGVSAAPRDDPVEKVIRNIGAYFEGFWSLHAIRVEKQEDADIRVLFTGTGSRDAYSPPLRFPLKLQQIVENPFGWNWPTRSYRMGRLMSDIHDAYHRLPYTPIQVNPAYFEASLRKEWTAGLFTRRMYDIVQEQVPETLAHEMAHAHGFSGHIKPDVSAALQYLHYYDVMQEGFVSGKLSKFRFESSEPFLLLLLGKDWRQENLQEAIDWIHDGKPQMDPVGEVGNKYDGKRYHHAYGSDLVQIKFVAEAMIPHGNAEGLTGTLAAEDEGRTLHLTGRRSDALPLDYYATVDTILEFDFNSPCWGTICEVGLDDDLLADDVHGFQLCGTPTHGHQDYRTYASGSGWTHYRIPVGQYYTGWLDCLFFVNSQDPTDPRAESLFRDVVVTEKLPTSDPNAAPTQGASGRPGGVEAAEPAPVGRNQLSAPLAVPPHGRN